MRYPGAYQSLLEPLRAVIATGIPPSSVHMGLSMNFNKLDDATSATVTTCESSAVTAAYHVECRDMLLCCYLFNVFEQIELWTGSSSNRAVT